ncbi:MAG: signal peptidase I [Bdellovibrionales bacterium RIFOXYD12_FULL_39_22]|nr:MAG: signal peptidase I [Bdellovibrionales bacterium RIFOXYB1_FULL_39_21]OFZ45135.1 MAG: signal peptidase I [Bdellovibrionales bacterium RIFOXYC12_FULL_39_17]OFZ45673.1 MAG: signal peptidase I [Bdellovibrionales bacterium RIFOXYC1_FULL_39_130]OFZ71784.1 MAG: signal peptidase I [Bdellovibrionales bacterium RIFOXYC2_FULL_39_8]OFZ77535.1 MAG: signal peptidase I [Bdellovibrionales bacterium RIFOXYD1_FULL_39_84]OFZ91664.1 MAG: signal peptidase I [Bdellovibrionales bacterium RIFOXYD12_FULL_39_22]
MTADDSSKTSLPTKKGHWREYRFYYILIFFILIARSIFLEPFKIPTGSMIPSLLVGDFILVNKMAYGLKVPFSDIGNHNPVYLAFQRAPSRGDVVVFKFPKDKDLNYVKRIIGLPGDTLEIKDKTVYINDVPIGNTEISGDAFMHDMDKSLRDSNLKFFKTRTGEHEHIIQQDTDNYYQTNYPKRKIPAKKYFMMGDNRDFSFDSRFWGLVDEKLIKGRAFLVWFSLTLPSADSDFIFRPHRIGTRIY